MKKVISVILALIMLASVSVSAFAEERPAQPEAPFWNSLFDRNIANQNWAEFICEDHPKHWIGMGFFGFDVSEISWDAENGCYFTTMTFDLEEGFDQYIAVMADSGYEHELVEEIPKTITLKYVWNPEMEDENVENRKGFWVLDDATYIARVKCGAEVTTYTVTYTDGTGEQLYFEDQVFTVVEGDRTPRFNGFPTRDDRDFAGWYPELAATVTENAVYTPNWTFKVVGVYFNANGGSCSLSQKGMPLGSLIGNLPVPERDGYDFLGWYVEDVKADKNYRITGETYFVAHWQKILIEEEIVVPEELTNVTVEDVKKSLKEAAAEKQAPGKKYEIVYMEISIDTTLHNNSKYEVLIPYPAGTDANDDFIVTHFKENGTTEVLSAKKTADGLIVTVDSFSPFAVSYSINKTSEKEYKDEIIVNIGATEEANPNTGAPVMFVPFIAVAAAVIAKKRK